MPEVPSSSVPENRNQPVPRLDLGDIFKQKLGPEAGERLPELLNDYSKRYREAFDALKNPQEEEVQRALAALAQNNDKPTPFNQNDGIRALLASEAPTVAEMRRQILDEIDKSSQEQKDKLVPQLFDAIKDALIIDFALPNQLREQKMIAGYRNVVPNTDAWNKIQEGLAFINGGPRTPRLENGTPQEETLAIYLNSVRQYGADPELQTLLATGRIKTITDDPNTNEKGFVSQTIDRYRTFLRNSKLDPDLFCPNAEFLAKLCQGIGLQNQLGVFDITSSPTGVDRRSPEARALREYQERHAQEVYDASRPQGPLADINVDASKATGFGWLLNGVNSAMNFAGGLVPEPGHIIGADSGDLLNVAFKLYLGTAGILNLATLGAGTLKHANNGFGFLVHGDLSNATSELTGVFKDIYNAIPGPVGTGTLLLAFGASRFTSPQEAEKWLREKLSAAGTGIQQLTGRDILGDIAGMGQDVAHWFGENIGPYYQKGKDGVMELFNDGWSKISNLTREEYHALGRFVDSAGYKMDELYPHYACQHELKASLKDHFTRENVDSAVLESYTMNNVEFDALLKIYQKNITATIPNLTISYQDLVDAKVITSESLAQVSSKPPFTPSPELAEKLKKQADWLSKNPSVSA